MNKDRPSAGDLPYRPCVGTMVLNRAGLVFVGQRIGGSEQVDALHRWQMPQGGVDPGEELYRAALRELREETNMTSVELLAESEGWFCYDIPRELIGRAWKGRFRGQRQKWYALRFIGPDAEIDLAGPGGHEPEFTAWRWVSVQDLPDLVVPFKRQVYEAVIAEFAHLTGAPGA